MVDDGGCRGCGDGGSGGGGGRRHSDATVDWPDFALVRAFAQ